MVGGVALHRFYFVGLPAFLEVLGYYSASCLHPFYIYLFGKIKVKPTTFGHNIKDNIYGDTIQTWVKIRNEIELTIDRIEEDFYNILLKWWESKSKVRIESNNKIPYLCNFIDTDLDLNDDYDEENNVTVYNGNVKFR